MTLVSQMKAFVGAVLMQAGGVQMVVEKSLAAEGTSRQEIGREAFTQRVWDWRRLYGPCHLKDAAGLYSCYCHH